MKRQREPLGKLCNLTKGISPISKTPPGPYTLVTTGEERKTAETFQFDGEAVCIPVISSTGHGHASLKRVHYQTGKFALSNLLVAAQVKNASVLSARYLAWYLTFTKDRFIVPLMTGAANMSISVDRLATVPVEFPSLSAQARIVHLLAEADELRELRAQANRRTAELVPALFYEMFGDPLEKRWPAIRLGDVLVRTDQRDPTANPDKEFLYVDISSVDNKMKVIVSAKNILGKDAPSRARKIIHQGDVIVSTVRPNLNAVALVPPNLNDQICSTGFSVLRPSPKTTSGYVFAFACSPFFIEHLLAKTKGANYPAVGESAVKDVPLPLPPLSLQKEFDTRIAEIRALEAEQVASRRHLDGLFQSILHDAFSEGL